MIGPITEEHYEKILRINEAFVHWLSPLDRKGLIDLLTVASYAKQIDDADGVLIGYAHDVDYDHKNIAWLRALFDKFHYIDRVFIDHAAHGKGLARKLYDDLEKEARRHGLSRLVCEVNTQPNNPASHAFHLKLGFRALEDVDYPEWNSAVRYYEKPLLPAN